MAVNKVVYDGQTIIDISDSTVTPETLESGAVAYNAKGERIVGVGNAVSSGLSATAAALLIEILRNALYESDQALNIETLAAALGASGEPAGPEDLATNMDVITGNCAIVDGTKITYQVDSVRCVTNPVAFYVEQGKKYTVSFDSYANYGFYVNGCSYSGNITDFEVVEGTQEIFNGDFRRILRSGWQYADYSFEPDGTYSVVYLQFRNLANGTLTSDDAAAIKQLLHIYVEEV